MFQVYGKGSGKECRKHVQKLNMVQGEREKREGKGGASHPPCDYANTFTTQSTGAKETQVRKRHRSETLVSAGQPLLETQGFMSASSHPHPGILSLALPLVTTPTLVVALTT